MSRGRRSSTPTSTRSSPRSSSATIPRCAGGPVIVGGGVVLAASYEAKAFGVRTAMGGAQARRSARRRRRAARACRRLQRGEPGGVRGLPRHDARSSRASRSTRRSSTCAGWSAIAGTPERDRRAAAGAGARRGRAADHGRRRAHEVPGEGRERRRQAGRPAGRRSRTDELAFLHPLPVERLWGVGPETRRRLHARGLTTVGQVAAARRGALVALLGAAAGRHLHALAHNRDPRRVRAGRAGARSARSARSGDAAAPSRRSTPSLVGARRPRRRGGCAAADRVGRTVVLRLRFGDFTRATRSTTLAARDRRHRAILAAARSCSARRPPVIERARPDAGRRLGREPRGRRAPSSSRCRSTRPARRRSTPRSTRCASGSAPRRSPARCCSAATPGLAMPILPD